jgi:pre-mRNA cleavage complex 2 protein Pcf11
MDAVRQEYKASLADLTFNSRPIITNLTVIAQESMQYAPAIISAIEDHIRMVGFFFIPG